MLISVPLNVLLYDLTSSSDYFSPEKYLNLWYTVTPSCVSTVETAQAWRPRTALSFTKGGPKFGNKMMPFNSNTIGDVNKHMLKV